MPSAVAVISALRIKELKITDKRNLAYSIILQNVLSFSRVLRHIFISYCVYAYKIMSYWSDLLRLCVQIELSRRISKMI